MCGIVGFTGRHQAAPILLDGLSKLEYRGYDSAGIACGDSGGTTKERYLEILEFTHFVEFFSFNKIGENHKEKILVQRVTVIVALDLGTGNTKNPEYENE